jgi:LEA14-like dessication related protein
MKKGLLGFSILAGVGLFAYSIYAYVKKQKDLLEQFSYKITDFSLDTFNIQIIKGQIKVLFISLSDVEVTVQEFYLDFFFNGERVGYLEDVTAFIIPARGRTEIPFEYTLNPQLIFPNITDILSYTLKSKDASISVRGYATLKSGFVKATLPITYNTTIKEILSS